MAGNYPGPYGEAMEEANAIYGIKAERLRAAYEVRAYNRNARSEDEMRRLREEEEDARHAAHRARERYEDSLRRR